MSVAEEASGVHLDLADVESIGGIHTVHDDTGLERASQAADAASDIVADIRRVGECESGRTRCTLGRLVDVGGRESGRLVLATEVVQLDVVADEVHVRVDAELVKARSALKTASGGGAVDDLVRCCLDFVVAGELEGATGHLGAVLGSVLAGTGVVDRLPSTGRRRVLVEVRPGAFGVLVEVCPGAFGVVNGFPASCEKIVSNDPLDQRLLSCDLPLGASYLMSVGRAEAAMAKVAMVAAVNFMVYLLLCWGLCCCCLLVAGRLNEEEVVVC